MRRSLLSRRWDPPPSRVRLKVVNALPDVLWTSLFALKESAEAFPPLKAAVGGAIAICDIAEVSVFFAVY